MKDYFELSLFTLGGLFCSAAVYFLTSRLLVEFAWIELILLAIFGFTAVILLANSLKKITSPRNILHFQKASTLVQVKLPFFRKKKLAKADLAIIEYEFHSDRAGSDYHYKKTFWTEVYLVSKTRKRLSIFTVSSSKLWDYGLDGREQEVVNLTRQLIRSIAKELGLESRRKKRSKK